MDNFDLKKYLAEGKLLKEELEVGNTIEIDPLAFPNFEFPYGTRGEIFDINKADYASDDLVYTVKLKHIDSQGDVNDTLHIENPNQYLDEGKLLKEEQYSSKHVNTSDSQEAAPDDILSKEELIDRLEQVFGSEDMSHLNFFEKLAIKMVKRQITSKIKSGQIQTRDGIKAALNGN
jgi:hypothetical protein